jgi:hypothetical protein
MDMTTKTETSQTARKKKANFALTVELSIEKAYNEKYRMQADEIIARSLKGIWHDIYQIWTVRPFDSGFLSTYPQIDERQNRSVFLTGLDDRCPNNDSFLCRDHQSFAGNVNTAVSHGIDCVIGKRMEIQKSWFCEGLF